MQKPEEGFLSVFRPFIHDFFNIIPFLCLYPLCPDRHHHETTWYRSQYVRNIFASFNLYLLPGFLSFIYSFLSSFFSQFRRISLHLCIRFFLFAFEKFCQKVTISYVMSILHFAHSVCLSVRPYSHPPAPNNAVHTEQTFIKFFVSDIFSKYL